MEYFFETYEECRDSFRIAAKELKSKYNSVQLGKIEVESNVDPDLTVDWCYIPAQKTPEKLLVLTSGIHGIEGYTGSAIQLAFIKDVLKNELLEKLGILLIHGANPYGFKYHRKVTEYNVDLNRNCANNKEVFGSENSGYQKIVNFLNPEGEVSIDKLQYRFFQLNAIYKIIKESLPVLRQAALQGQYEFEKGIYYGGRQYEPQIKAISSLLKEIANKYDIILNVDLHTGYGERGITHLFINPIGNKTVLDGLNYIFKDEEIDWGNSKDFYTINGEYVNLINNVVRDKLCIPMCFEVGTMDSNTTLGALKSIQIMISENQGAHFGYKDQKSEAKVKDDFLEMYYPSSNEWRARIIKDNNEKLRKMLVQFQKYEGIKN